MFFANRILDIVVINGYTIGTFVYEYTHGNVIDIFEISSEEIKISKDLMFAMQMIFMYLMERIRVRKFSIEIAGANLFIQSQ